MIKKLLVLIVVVGFVGVACFPMWTSRMADEAFENPTAPISPEAVRKAIKAKMYIYLFEDAKQTAEKAIIYFPESKEMPFFIYNAAICSDKSGNKDAAIYWYQRFIENYPKHEWTDQARRALEILRGMKN